MNREYLYNIISTFINEGLLSKFKTGELSADQIHRMKALRNLASEEVGHKIHIYNIKDASFGLGSYANTPSAREFFSRPSFQKFANVTMDSWFSLFSKEYRTQNKRDKTKTHVTLSDQDIPIVGDLESTVAHELGHHITSHRRPEETVASMEARNKAFKKREDRVKVVKDEALAYKHGIELQNKLGMNTENLKKETKRGMNVMGRWIRRVKK